MKYILPAGTKVDLYFRNMNQDYREVTTETEYDIIIDVNLLRVAKQKLGEVRVDKVVYDEFVMWFDGSNAIKLRD